MTATPCTLLRSTLVGLFLLYMSMTPFAWSKAQEERSDERPRITGLHIGFEGHYKLGCWTPLTVSVVGGSESTIGRIEVTVPDTDGVPTTITTPPGRPVAVGPGEEATAALQFRVGQSNASIHVTYISSENRKLAERTFFTGPYSDEKILGGLPATNRLFLEFGPRVGLGDLLTGENDEELARTQLIPLDSASTLPTDWLGYEGIERLFLSTSEVEPYRPLAQNTARLDALEEWIKMGGKLVLFCGANSEELLGAEGVLARFLPGEFREIISLQSAKSLQNFSQVDREVTSDRRFTFPVPRIADVRGSVMAAAQHGAEEIPVVIRNSLGFGEITFVAFDFDKPPLREWDGRQNFLRRIVYGTTSATAQQENSAAAQQISGDLVNQVRTVLDNSFAGVQIIPFGLVAVMVLGYILLVGPGDYYLVHKLLKRPELTWVTFPLAVVGVSAAAYWYANWMKGDELRVNQVEFIDVDHSSQLTRGTTWTHFFSPTVAEFDLSYQPFSTGGEQLAESQQVVSWLGQPGYALGGMQTNASSTGWFDAGYHFTTAYDAMVDLPVQLWSTKTITARWSGRQAAEIKPVLQRTEEQLLEGTLENDSPITWQDCVLLYGQWAWDVGQIRPHATVNIADLKQPRLVRTLLTNATAGDETITQTADDGTVQFRLGMNDVTRLAKTMMFYDAINGARYTNTLHRYQSFLDMSHFLDLPDRAILIAQHQQGHGSWLNGEEPLASDQDKHWTYYRFVLPVEEN